MKKFYQYSVLLYLIFSVTGLFAQTGSLTAPAPAPNGTGRYQLIDLDPAKPCNCNEKTPRHSEMYQGVQEQDIRKYKMIAYKFSFGPSIDQAAKLFRALEEDPAVMKISVREWDYLMLFTNPDFDKLSFDTAAKQLLGGWEDVTPADFFLHKNSQLHQLYQHVFPNGEPNPITPN